MYSLLYRDKTESQELHRKLTGFLNPSCWLVVCQCDHYHKRNAPNSNICAAWLKQESCLYNRPIHTRHQHWWVYNVYNKQSRLQSTDQNTDHSTIQPAKQASVNLNFGGGPSACRHRSLHSAEPAQRNRSQPRSTSAAGCVHRNMGVPRPSFPGNHQDRRFVGVEHLGTDAPEHGEMFIWGYPSQQKETLTPSAGQHLLHQELCRKSPPLQKMGVIGQLQISGRPIWERKQLECRSEILCRPLVGIFCF